MHDDADDQRKEQRERWSGISSNWQRLAHYVSDKTRPVTDQMVEMLALRTGERVLDLAGGVGDPSIRVAELVRPGGSVLLLDMSPTMVANAEQRARALGLDNVECRVIERETELGVPAGQFDAATCRFGLMFMPDAVAALEAVRGALRPNGRLAVATWGPAENNPWPPFWRSIVGRYAEAPAPLFMQQQWLAVSSFDGLEGVMIEAGFEDVQTVSVEVVVAQGQTPAELWDAECEIALSLQEALAPLGEEQRAAVRDDAIRAMDAMFEGQPPRFMGEALVSLGFNPGD